MSDHKHPSPDSELRKGEFPFPLVTGETEPKYLTWVRNHSSYLSVAGFIGALRAIAAYMRGVAGNLLILMPVLIFLGLVLGWFHFSISSTPLYFSRWTLIVALVATSVSYTHLTLPTTPYV